MKIYVGNLSRKITDTQLSELALPFGKPNSSHIARELVGGASKGFAFVEYRLTAEAEAAIAGLHGKVVNGQTLNVFEATAMKPRLWPTAAHR